ncbi:MAG: hypothetical protein H6704_25215 [Myxococcales bacterium]|nr:hypothetical protein [Myxococcales bacterium]
MGHDLAVRVLSNLGDNDLHKFARNTLLLTVTPPTAATVVSVRVEREGVEVADVPVDEAVEGTDGRAVSLAVDLGTERWPEGLHALRVIATLDDGRTVERDDEVRVLFDVSDVAVDAADARLLWVATFEGGLVAYDLGDDPLDAADDRVTAYGGHAAEFEDLSPPRGRPWQGEGGLYEQDEPAGRVGLTVAALHGGVYFGAAFRGLSFLDHRGTPHDPSDDLYGLFHPGALLEPETIEAGFANCVSDVQPDGADGLWLATFHGLFHVDHAGTPADARDDTWTFFDPDGAYDPNLSKVRVDRTGHVWLAGFDVGAESAAGNTVVVLDPAGTPSDPADDTWARLALPGGFAEAALALELEGDRLVWIGTSDGLWRLDHGGTPLDPADDSWTRFGRDTGLPDDQIGAVLPRGDGTVWVGGFDACGGDGGGLALLDPRGCLPGERCDPMVTYTVDDGLLDDDVSSLALLPDGQVVLGSFNALVAPLVATLSGAPGGERCVADERPEATSNPGRPRPPTEVGRDGLAVIDPGADPTDKADDALLNL